ncbi:MAG: nucleotidyltransferase substrate binding protein [Megasphaera sp.]|jgi:nucleotidyltransferase substrate binding protein (TIGR01987 family)|nr:nucleotidyltransferase substrate binding protein [Megasphaera sp.]
MDTYETFSNHLELLAQGDQRDMSDIFIAHGLVHLFMEQFDLGLALFRAALHEDDQVLLAMGSPREVILAAYDTYLFVDEDVWLAMLKDRNGNMDDGIEGCVARIMTRYIAAFRRMEEELKGKCEG